MKLVVTCPYSCCVLHIKFAVLLILRLIIINGLIH